jgi:hypothetical protein
VVDLGEPFGDGAVVVNGTKNRANVGPLGGRAAGEQQKGHVVRECLGSAGKRVLGPWPALHTEHSDAAAVGGPAEPIGYRHSHSLLAAGNGPDAGQGGRLDQRLVWIASQELGAFPFQDFCDSLYTLHSFSPFVGLVNPVLYYPQLSRGLASHANLTGQMALS